MFRGNPGRLVEYDDTPQASQGDTDVIVIESEEEEEEEEVVITSVVVPDQASAPSTQGL